MKDISIAIESPRQPSVIALIEALDKFHEIYPPEANHFLDIEGLCAPDVHLLVGRRAGAAIGIAALWIRRDFHLGEVKRMFVQPAARGSGLAESLLERIETIARENAIARLALETGTLNVAAHKLYERAGFARCGPFADYPEAPFSVFMEKRLEL